MPAAVDRKYPDASADWQWVFPQENRWINPETKGKAAITWTNYWSTEP